MRQPPSVMSFAVLLAGLAAGGAGCLQIETHIKLNEDGSAVIRERVLLSERLLDLAGEKRGEWAALAGKERLLERMKRMGEGLTLVNHQTRTGGDGWIESAAEMAIPDLNGLRYVAPWPAHDDYAENSAIRVQLKPQIKGEPAIRAGMMTERFVHDKAPKGRTAPPALAPAELQVYRDIGPVFRDMLKGFRLRLTFEAYAPIGSSLGPVAVDATAVDLIDVSDAKLDGASRPFFANEEIMVELARLDFGGGNVAGNVQRDSTMPEVQPLGGGGGAVWFPPSKTLFEKYLAGKKLDFAIWQPSPPEKHVEARFEAIGWQARKQDPAADKAPAPATTGGK